MLAAIISISTLIIGILAYRLDWLKFKKEHIDEPRIIEPKAEKEYLIIKLMQTQTLSLTLQANLEKLISITNSGHSEMIAGTGISYQNYLDTLKENHKIHLSDKVIESAKNIETNNKLIIESMIKSISEQCGALEQINNEAIVRLRQFS